MVTNDGHYKNNSAKSEYCQVIVLSIQAQQMIWSWQSSPTGSITGANDKFSLYLVRRMVFTKINCFFLIIIVNKYQFFGLPDWEKFCWE